ncbi:hypothetical protein PGT21_030698 [Puccinia graminis f. sp. tritici]|uniref:Uncharacterized protein n=1 Tax=Puccinia graminis f. sp. tritici TaxID=56615 RepID=A0A5B0PPC6_PUCGR|nr:hypothetical protein PGT21_030698 [Puccinia graminis f. sp. tritici]
MRLSSIFGGISPACTSRLRVLAGFVTPRVHTHVDRHRFSTGSPRAATAGGRTRTRQSTGFRGLHGSVHSCVPRMCQGAHEGAPMTTDTDLATPPKERTGNRTPRADQGCASGITVLNHWTHGASCRAGMWIPRETPTT